MRAKSISSRKLRTLGVDRGDAGEEAQDELLLAHLEAEDADVALLTDGGVLRDVEGEARLAHAGPGGDHDEVALLQARGQGVEVCEPGSHPADLAAVGVQVVEAVVGRVEELSELAEARIDAPLADGEQLRLGPVDRLLDLGRILVADAGDAPGGDDQVAQDRLAFDDPSVLHGMDRGRRLVAQAGEVRAAADLLELVRSLEHLRHGHDVDRLPALEQIEHRREDQAVRLPVEVVRAEELGDLDHGVPVDEDGAENGLLGLEALGRKAIDHAGRTPAARGWTVRLVEPAGPSLLNEPGRRGGRSSTRIPGLWTAVDNPCGFVHRLNRACGSPRSACPGYARPGRTGAGSSDWPVAGERVLAP
jgi:hypothetical protein